MDFLVGRAGCVVQTLPNGSGGAAAAASGDSLAAARARSSVPCTPRGAEMAFGKKLASLAEALLRSAEGEEEDDDDDDGSGNDGDENGERRRREKKPLVLIGEQYIVKPARGGLGTSFAWHADGAWLEAGASEAGPLEPPKRGGAGAASKQERKKKKKRERQTYVSIWIPLDDVSPGNGGLVLPCEDNIERMASERRRRKRGAESEEEEEEEETEDIYLDDDSSPSSSIPLVAAAGTAVAMASWLRHASSPNDSERPRRAWMPQLKLGAVEVEVEVGEEEDGEGGGRERGGDRATTRAAAAAVAAARETWRVPVPCFFFECNNKIAVRRRYARGRERRTEKKRGRGGKGLGRVEVQKKKGGKAQS